MRTVLDAARYGLCLAIAGALLPACASQGTPAHSASGSLLPQIGAKPQTSKVERVLYSFKGGKDGINPEPELTAVGGTLYGTTVEGGDPSCTTIQGGSGCGTLFRIDTSGGKYEVLYRFGKSATSGTYPTYGVIAVGSTLFGSAFYGGGDGACDPSADGCGTLYEVGTSGKGFKAVHTFTGEPDGKGPYANLVSGGNGIIYGATNSGGSGCPPGGCGTVYEFDTGSGAESVVYRFKGGKDGTDPIGVTDVNGVLYGATYDGGASSACASATRITGCGTIFKIDPNSGKESVLYRFKGGQDGAFPTNVLSVNGDLYGTTQNGGGSACTTSGFSGCGTVFRVSASSGAEKVLYRFKGGNDGWFPNQILASIKGALYATTQEGGTGCGGSGCGTIFKIDTSGKGYAVVYSFSGGSDGAYPLQGVTVANGTLYGTTWLGGGSGCGGGGCGTVFEATP